MTGCLYPTPGRGFTLIEMLVVLSLVAVLASAAMPVLELSARRARESELRTALRTLREAIDRYKEAADSGAIVRNDNTSAYPPNLQTLVQGVPLTAQPGKRLYLLRRLPRDPFADSTVPAADTWVLRASDSPPDAPRPGRDVFDVASRSTARALDQSRYSEW